MRSCAKIMTKAAVAKAFGKSERWVTRAVSRGALPCHYAGDTALFYEDEVVDAFLNNSLEQRKRVPYDPEEKEPKWRDEIRSTRQNRRSGVLQEIRQRESREQVG